MNRLNPGICPGICPGIGNCTCPIAWTVCADSPAFVWQAGGDSLRAAVAVGDLRKSLLTRHIEVAHIYQECTPAKLGALQVDTVKTIRMQLHSVQICLNTKSSGRPSSRLTNRCIECAMRCAAAAGHGQHRHHS